MKKKIVLLLLASILAISGCGKTNATPNNSTSENKNEQNLESPETENTELDSLGEIEVEENLFTVELTIPADYVEATTQEELDKSAEEHGYKSITLNDDGSATYIMTKAQHKELMEELAASFNSALDEMVGSEDYPNFTEITTNSDFTEFKITTTSTELDFNESLSVIVFYMYGSMYNVFNGESESNIHIDFVNSDTGEVISSSDSSDLADME